MIKRLYLALVVLLCTLPAMAQTGDLTPPSITIGLADPARMDSCLPLADGQIVTPDARGLVRFRAEIRDAGSGVRNVSMTVPRASCSMYSSTTPRTFIGAAWSTRNDANGAVGQVTVTAFDYAGNRASKTITVTLQRP
jgi:hypothetical protein